MGFIAKIQRYADGVSNNFENVLPQHSHSFSRGEDHFDLAYQDTQMIIAGMRKLDDELKLNVDTRGNKFEVIYRIKSIEER